MKGRPPKAPDEKASVIKSVRFTPTEWTRFEHVRDARSLGSISALVLFWLDRDELSHGKAFDGASPDARQARFPDRTFATQRRTHDAAALELLRDSAYDPAELAVVAGLNEAQARASINRLFLAGKLAMRNDQRYYAVGSAGGAAGAARLKRTKKRKSVPAREAAQKAPDPAPAKKRRKAAPPARPAVKKGSPRSRGRAAPAKAAARKARPAARKARTRKGSRQ